MAARTALYELRFLISEIGVAVCVVEPSVLRMVMTTLMFGSKRMCPFSMIASLAPMNLQVSRTHLQNLTASSAVVKSGSVTISRSGEPARLRSMSVWSLGAPPGNSCRSLPASSSRCARLTLMVVVVLCSFLNVTLPFSQSGASYWLIWYPFGRSG